MSFFEEGVPLSKKIVFQQVDTIVLSTKNCRRARLLSKRAYFHKSCFSSYKNYELINSFLINKLFLMLQCVKITITFTRNVARGIFVRTFVFQKIRVLAFGLCSYLFHLLFHLFLICCKPKGQECVAKPYRCVSNCPDVCQRFIQRTKLSFPTGSAFAWV